MRDEVHSFSKNNFQQQNIVATINFSIEYNICFCCLLKKDDTDSDGIFCLINSGYK
jgi:hypothetical protein